MPPGAIAGAPAVNAPEPGLPMTISPAAIRSMLPVPVRTTAVAAPAVVDPSVSAPVACGVDRQGIGAHEIGTRNQVNRG